MLLAVAVMWTLMVMPVVGDAAIPMGKGDTMKRFEVAQKFATEAECRAYAVQHMQEILRARGVPEAVATARLEDFLRARGTTEAGILGHLQNIRQMLGLPDGTDVLVNHASFSCINN